MQHSLEQSARRPRLYGRRNLLLAHLAGQKPDARRWPQWAKADDAADAQQAAEANRPGMLMREAARLLAVTAAVYLLAAILVGILTRSP
jgi:hypothetical protein